MVSPGLILATGISVDSTGNSSVTGEVQGGTATFGAGEPNETSITSPTGGVLFVARYDASGNLMWARQSTAATQAVLLPAETRSQRTLMGPAISSGWGARFLAWASRTRQR